MTLCSHSNNTVHIFIYLCMSDKIFFFWLFIINTGLLFKYLKYLPVNMGDLHWTDVRIPIYWCGFGHIKPPSCITRVLFTLNNTRGFLDGDEWFLVLGPRQLMVPRYNHTTIIKSRVLFWSRHRSCSLFVKLLSDDGEGRVVTFQFGPDVVWVICHDRNQSRWFSPYETHILMSWHQWCQGPRQRWVSIVQWTLILWRDFNVCHSSIHAPIFELVS